MQYILISNYLPNSIVRNLKTTPFAVATSVKARGKEELGIEKKVRVKVCESYYGLGDDSID